MGENGLKGVVEGVIDDAVDKVVGVPIRKGRQNKKDLCACPRSRRKP